MAGLEQADDGAPAQFQERGCRQEQGLQLAAERVLGLFMGFYG